MPFESSSKHKMESSAAPGFTDQKTVTLINTYVVQTARLINNFAATCEGRLLATHAQMQELDTRLAMLERRLASVEDPEELSDPNEEEDDSHLQQFAGSRGSFGGDAHEQEEVAKFRGGLYSTGFTGQGQTMQDDSTSSDDDGMIRNVRDSADLSDSSG